MFHDLFVGAPHLIDCHHLWDVPVYIVTKLESQRAAI